jgi:hypothetical protein
VRAYPFAVSLWFRLDVSEYYVIRTITIFDSCVGRRGSREACEILKSHTGLVLHSLSRVEMVTPTITIVRRKTHHRGARKHGSG